MTGHSGRGRKTKPGRITFVGSGPGDLGLLTTRARTVLANAALVFTDPDVPEAGLALVGSELPQPSGPEPDWANTSVGEASAAEDPDAAYAQPRAFSVGTHVRSAVGYPVEVAKTLTAEARNGL